MDWLRLVVWRIQCACTCPLWFGHTFLSFFLPAEYFFVPLSWYEIHDICIAFSVQQALYVDRGLMRSIRSQNGWRCVRDGEVSEVMRPGSVIRAQIWSRRAIRNYQLPAITNYQLHHSDGNHYPRCLLPSMSLQCQARTTLVENSNST